MLLYSETVQCQVELHQVKCVFPYIYIV